MRYRQAIQNNIVLGTAGAILFLATGCSTVSSRINKNFELFSGYPTDVQEKIRVGEIDLGFTKEMIRIALGEPDRIYERKDTTGLREIWAYAISLEYRHGGYRYVYDACGYYDRGYYPYYVRRYKYQYVVFKHDKVVAIELEK